MNKETFKQTSHIEFTAQRGSVYQNSFCILCGVIGIAMFVIGWIYVTLFPIT